MIYLDHAATTPMREEVLHAMLPFCREEYGNPSGMYRLSQKAARELKKARETIADTLGCELEEIYMTSGGTESDNWAIRAAVLQGKGHEKHIITSAIEHPAVRNPCRRLEEQGYDVTWLPVGEEGRISLQGLKQAMRKDTILVSLMYANNEMGAVQPVEEAARLAAEAGIPFHTDAVQAYGHLPICVRDSGITMLSASAHKFNGPKGVGFLYVSHDFEPEPLLYGGGQERGKRSGTENVASIIGMAEAARLSHEGMEERERYVASLRDYLMERLCREIPFCSVNGGRKHRLAGNCSISFQFVEGASLLLMLDEKNICASAGSACSTGSGHPSHVLTALGVPQELASGTLRLTVGWQNTFSEMDYVIEQIKAAVAELRKHSPDYEDMRNQRRVKG